MRGLRRSRFSFRKRRWRPLRWIAALLLLIALTWWLTDRDRAPAALASTLLVMPGWSPLTAAPPEVRYVEIMLADTGTLRLDGQPVTLSMLEARLVAMERHGLSLAVILIGKTSPEGVVEQMLARHRIAWLSDARLAPPDSREGNNGR